MRSLHSTPYSVLDMSLIAPRRDLFQFNEPFDGAVSMERPRPSPTPAHLPIVELRQEGRRSAKAAYYVFMGCTVAPSSSYSRRRAAWIRPTAPTRCARAR